jgi:serine/threonine-protein kinase
MSSTTTTPPAFIGRYLIKGELGRGGMATVYRGFDPQVKREVAVKVLPRHFLHDPSFRSRFEREAQTIAGLEHPAIVPLYDFGEQDGQPFIIMRLMPGGSLADRLKTGPLPPTEAARILSRLAPALDYAHRKGIVHRDLKPGNILFDLNNEPYISDFGIAKLSEGGGSVTGSGIVGTPAYMSPEQAQGQKDLDGRSDVYALGTILFEMLTGKLPYEADTPVALILKHLTEPVPRLLTARPDLPSEFETVIDQAMAKDRTGRFSTAQAMADTLASAIRGDGAQTLARATARVKVPPTQVGAIKPEAPSRPARPVSVWIVAALMVVGLITVGLAVTRLLVPALSTPPTATLDSVAIAATQSAGSTQTIEAATIAVIETQNAGAADAIASATAEALATAEARLALTATVQANIDAATAAQAQANADATATVIAGLNAAEAATVAVAAATANAQATTDAQLSAPRIAFIANGDVWIVNLDGSNLKQLTTEGGEKTALRWLPDGRTVSYITGLCLKLVDSLTAEGQTLTCLNYAPSVDGFEVSPDGKYFAISVEGKLHIGFYDPANLASVNSRRGLEASATCMLYSQNYVESARWSSDGQKLAVEVQIPLSGLKADTIRLFDFACGNNTPRKLEEFPGTWFTMPGYEKKPELQGFGWDSDVLFAFTDEIRNEGFGNIYAYNYSLKRPPRQIFPVTGGACCYRDPQWSPDGKTLVFAFQDIATGANSVTELYYIPYGEVGGVSAMHIPLPDGFFKNVREGPQPVMAPER